MTYFTSGLSLSFFQPVPLLTSSSLESYEKDDSRRFTWPKTGQNIKLWSKNCFRCQQNRISRHTNVKTCQINDDLNKFSHMLLDIVRPLSAVPDSPHWYLETFNDRMTKWVEAQPVSSNTADVISEALLNLWFF